MYQHDWIEYVRRKFQPPLHAVLSEVGLYAIAETGQHRYTCTTDLSEEELEKKLVKLGFYRNPLAALKRREVDGNKQISTGSWFYFTMEDPIKVLGFPLPKYQYHLTIYDNAEGGIDCYIHKEYWWGTNPGGHYQSEHLEPVPRWLRKQFTAGGIDFRLEK